MAVRKRVKKTMRKAKAKMSSGAQKIKKATIISKQEAKKLLNAFIAELKQEAKRFEKFAKKELKREAKKVKRKAKPALRKAVKRAKKALRR